MEKKYVVKEKYKKVAETLIRENVTGDVIIFENSPAYNLFKDKGVLDEFCDEVKEEWKDPLLTIKSPTWMTDKILLLIRMQSWADYHNKLDGFVVDWGVPEQSKYGIEIRDKGLKIDDHQSHNFYIFQISVSSEDRAKQMLDYFRKDIQSLIDKGLI